MSWKVSDASRILHIDKNLVKKLAFEFQEHLSATANPQKGNKREFSNDDLLVFAYIIDYWEESPDYESIKIGLNCENQKSEKYYEILYFNLPIFQELPSDLDETWTHGIVLNGAKINQPLEVARAYKYAADTLVKKALEADEALYLDYPIFFNYRHCLELYLKIIGEVEEETHSLIRCVNLVERKFGKKMGRVFRNWVEEFEKIDKKGTTFRYADDQSLLQSEYWVDLQQLSTVMSKLCQLIEEVFRDKSNNTKRTESI